MNVALAAAIFEVPASTPTNLTAQVSDTMADSGLLAILVISAAIPLVFYIAHHLLRLIPRDRYIITDKEFDKALRTAKREQAEADERHYQREYLITGYK